MRLFVKIFLWFWAAMVIATFAFALVLSIAPEQTIARWRSSTTTAVILYAQSAAEEMDRYGVHALDNYFDRLQSSGRVRAALLDENGNLIAGQVGRQAIALAPRTQLGGSPEFTISPTAAVPSADSRMNGLFSPRTRHSNRPIAAIAASSSHVV